MCVVYAFNDDVYFMWGGMALLKHQNEDWTEMRRLFSDEGGGRW